MLKNMQNLHQGHLHVYIVMLPLKNNMYLLNEKTSPQYYQNIFTYLHLYH